ncbi:HEPN domain-containing protein [Azohydromonas aeria]|uniref:HEPN domain-containing protein n=1 Tax=Azohydromonas aeria TaxID=2590212 RepID=UPI0012FAB380|nr:MAE_28990/MAE_18760 family HEPN-like nuclease [Azohydromonas aeria]
MAYFDATATFDGALAEVDLFIEHAIASLQKHKPVGYSTFLKAGFVLLGAKFEAFAENIIEDYLKQVGKRKPKAKHLPPDLRVQATSFILANCTFNGIFQGKPEKIRDLKNAARLWDFEAEIDSIKANNKFNYGKHGSKELAGLFERVGINDIYQSCQIEAEEPESLIVENKPRRSIAPDIDSLTHVRNNIIHSDASPGNITHQQLRGYRLRLWEFAYLIDLRMAKELIKIEECMESEM